MKEKKRGRVESKGVYDTTMKNSFGILNIASTHEHLFLVEPECWRRPNTQVFCLS